MTALDEDYEWCLHIVCWSKQHTNKMTKGKIRKIKKKYELSFLRFNHYLTSYQGKPSLNSVNLWRTMKVARASATYKTTYYISEETIAVKDCSRTQYVQDFNDCGTYFLRGIFMNSMATLWQNLHLELPCNNNHIRHEGPSGHSNVICLKRRNISALPCICPMVRSLSSLSTPVGHTLHIKVNIKIKIDNS